MLEYDSYKYSERTSLIRGTRWATDEEIMGAARRVRLSDPQWKCSGLPVISDGKTVYLDESDAHSLIIGSTGSKKTRLFAMPMLEFMRRANESVVVSDPKGELYDLTAARFAQSGYQVYVINLRDPKHSNGWNPLITARECMKAGQMDRMADMINDMACTVIPDPGGRKIDPFWINTSRAMFSGLALIMVENAELFPDETVNLLTLRHLSSHLIQRGDIPYGEHGLLDVVDTYPDDSIGRLSLEAVMRGTGRTFDNIKASYDADLQKLYMQRSLIDMLSVNEVRFQNLGLQKTILYLIMPDEKTTLHFVVSMVIKQCYEQLIELAQRCKNNTLPMRVNFLLDEFSNLPQIPDMPAMISAARSRNIKFFLIIQGLKQLSSKYGEEDAQTIKGNCGNLVFLTSRELPLLNEISDLCGEDAMTGEKLITVSQLQRLNKERGEALLLMGRQYPYITRLADISDYHLAPMQPLPFPVLPSCNANKRTLEELLEMIAEYPDSAEEEQIEDDMHEQPDTADSTLSEVEKWVNEKFEELFGESKDNEGNEEGDENGGEGADDDGEEDGDGETEA